MTLVDAIKNVGLSGSATVDEALAELDSDGSPVVDSTTYSLSGVADRLKVKGVNVMVLLDLRRFIRELPIGGDTLEGLLITGGGAAGGVDFSRDDIRIQIQANQQALAGAELTQTVLAQQAILGGLLLVGVTPRKKFAQVGLSELPSKPDVEAALAEIAVAEKCDYVAGILIPAAKADGKTWGEIKALIAGVE